MFVNKSTPDGLPEVENLDLGVLGHAESDCDGPGAPKWSKTSIEGPRLRFFTIFCMDIGLEIKGAPPPLPSSVDIVCEWTVGPAP